jgi:hypothetical protein
MSRRASSDYRQGRLALDLHPVSQQPPLQQGDRVRFIYDRDHVEIVETCELDTGPLTPHWRAITTWNGNRRIANAAEFVIEGAAP